MAKPPFAIYLALLAGRGGLERSEPNYIKRSQLAVLAVYMTICGFRSLYTWQCLEGCFHETEFSWTDAKITRAVSPNTC